MFKAIMVLVLFFSVEHMNCFAEEGCCKPRQDYCRVWQLIKTERWTVAKRELSNIKLDPWDIEEALHVLLMHHFIDTQSRADAQARRDVNWIKQLVHLEYMQSHRLPPNER